MQKKIVKKKIYIAKNVDCECFLPLRVAAKCRQTSLSLFTVLPIIYEDYLTLVIKLKEKNVDDAPTETQEIRIYKGFLNLA